ncbi:flagellar biosynthesis anti-sigma factor FlgM [Alteromonas oceanisediminis]|uniref:flagellar biosynthesis anti-sigma factor FlgM n=1 Tax=Alteromonas oceanisediminis TaxID=2836180 RepID=UPI001BDA25BF|nr:flagellar biosynthesis anti-sigma factor FlgM [Alteromonas oceanisediminis]MBT0584972.1 flagellar biosynthesis anti-sigma factor FlgM [Alteromonas oceanisediminis]
MTVNNINNGVPKTPIDNQKLSQQQAQNKGAAAQAPAQQAAAQATPRQDSVSLTQSAQQLNQVQKKGSEAPVNQEKVDRLKKAIQNGEYKVNPEVLADKISKLEGQIFGTR